jgi:hypothetical protein
MMALTAALESSSSPVAAYQNNIIKSEPYKNLL